MAVVCHPVKWSWRKFKYVKSDNDLLETATFFYENMPISIAHPISVFFCEVSKNLTPILEDYLTTKTNQVETELSAIREDLRKSTDG